ncbi:unnamed protein product [Toxocara canis]|uniref:Uncharacterized protein n=1 Tax=Toxocara canis TaxID=6265 RepID=A0A3P7H4H9_TOXCA|nr:unnamed protein product [Toxocara canis]
MKRHLKWKSVLREAIFELCIHISNNHLFIGVPLSRIPLSLRAYLQTNALRSTVCDAMLSLANIQEGMFVVDLTCGSSSILMQAAHDLPQKACFFRTDFLRFDAVDRIISDLPFGHRQTYCSKEESANILKRILDIFSRCSIGCEAVLLIAADHLPGVTSQLKGNSRLMAAYPLSLGTTQAALVWLANG